MSNYKGQKIWIISDTHWNHEKIIGYTKRPFKNKSYMEKELIRRWNSVVGIDDTVIVLGDFILSYGGTSEFKRIRKYLKGTIILVKGNHDKYSYSFILSNGVAFVCEKFEMYLRGLKVCFVHDPNTLKKLENGHYDLVIHGHTHNNDYKPFNPYRKTNFYNACVEKQNYTPKLLDSILDTYGKKGIKKEKRRTNSRLKVVKDEFNNDRRVDPRKPYGEYEN